MFFLGFTGFYACIIILCIICRVVRKFSDRFLVAAKKIKTACCAFVFTIFSYIFTLVYSILSIVSGDTLVSAALCAIFLVFSWWMVNWLYKLMTGEHESKEKQDKHSVRYRRSLPPPHQWLSTHFGVLHAALCH